MAGGATEEEIRPRAGTRALLSLAAGLDYRGLREAVIEGIPGLSPPPPGSLPEPEELEEEEERDRAEFEAEFGDTELAEALLQALHERLFG